MRLVILALMLWPSLAFADPLPRPASDKVNDWAQVISADKEAQLAANLAQVRRETGVHVLVVTMGDHADFGGTGESLESYSTRLFNDWGIGDSKRNNGVLILVTPERRAMRIELGSGFATAWNDMAKRIINDSFLPAFAEGDMEGGLLGGTDQVLERIARPFARGEVPAGRVPFELGLFAVIATAALFLVFKRWIGDLMTRFRPCPKCGGRGLHRSHTTELEATKFGPGRGTTVTRCDLCGHVDRQTYVIPMIRRRSSSGGGFGGGRSSGGGASGRW